MKRKKTLLRIIAFTTSVLLTVLTPLVSLAEGDAMVDTSAVEEVLLSEEESSAEEEALLEESDEESTDETELTEAEEFYEEESSDAEGSLEDDIEQETGEESKGQENTTEYSEEDAVESEEQASDTETTEESFEESSSEESVADDGSEEGQTESEYEETSEEIPEETSLDESLDTEEESKSETEETTEESLPEESDDETAESQNIEDVTFEETQNEWESTETLEDDNQVQESESEDELEEESVSETTWVEESELESVGESTDPTEITDAETEVIDLESESDETLENEGFEESLEETEETIFADESMEESESAEGSLEESTEYEESKKEITEDSDFDEEDLEEENIKDQQGEKGVSEDKESNDEIRDNTTPEKEEKAIFFEEERSSETIILTEEAEIVLSGSCGDKVNYTLDNNGSLIIYGEGEIKVGSFFNDDFKSVKKVEIKNGVTCIGAFAFAYLEELVEVIISNTVITIGSAAFKDCGKLETVILGDGVKTIESCAFSSCTNLKNISLPKSLIYLGHQAFICCDSITNIELPYGIEKIEQMTFWECSSLKSVIIPQSVTVIGPGSFAYCDKITDISIPKSVKTIGNNAFTYCGFTDLSLPESILIIGDSAFSECCYLNHIELPNSIISLGNETFYDCDRLKYIIFKGTEEKWTNLIEGKSLFGSRFGEWYHENPIVIFGDNSNQFVDCPTIWPTFSYSPKITYKDKYLDSILTLDLPILCMLPLDGNNNVEYQNVKVIINLPDELDFSSDASIKLKERSWDLGTMSLNGKSREDISTEVYIVSNTLVSFFPIKVSIYADGFSSPYKTTFFIPVEFENARAETKQTIIEAVRKYTSTNETKAYLEILHNTPDDKEMYRKLFEYFHCDNIFDLSDRCAKISDAKEAQFEYQRIMNDEMFLSWQFRHKLQTEPLAKAALVTSGLAFGGELGDWLNPGTYTDAAYPGVKKYKALLEEFIKKQNVEIEFFSYLKETQSFISDSVDLWSSVEKGEALKKLGKTTSLVECKSVFNDLIATKINKKSGGSFVLQTSEETPFMEAMGINGTVFDCINITLQGIMDFVDVNANMERYTIWHEFLIDIRDDSDMPFELRTAAYQLDKEMEEGYWTPILNIMRNVRDTLYETALDLIELETIVSANSYLLMAQFSALVINQFVDIGVLVENSCKTEGYVYLADHYKRKLENAKNAFLDNESEENAWAFYEAYTMLLTLRILGEEKWLETNKLQGGEVVDGLSKVVAGGTLGELLSEATGYKDDEAAAKSNIEMLQGCAFRYEGDDIPEEIEYKQKIVFQCPVNIDLYTSTENKICSMKDRTNSDVTNTSGRFICAYRPTTGDYVKIAFLNSSDSITWKATGTEAGEVSCTIVTASGSSSIVKGFDNIQVNKGSILEGKTSTEKVTVDTDGDGVVDETKTQITKGSRYVCFDYQYDGISRTVYANTDNIVAAPIPAKRTGLTFSGWYSSPNGEGSKFNELNTISENKVVYAYWTEEILEDIKSAIITLAKTSYTYNGKARKPAVTVTFNGNTLEKGTDFTVTYKANTNAGTAKVTITGKGSYTGTKTITFKITKAAQPLKAKAKKSVLPVTAKTTLTISGNKGKVTYKSGNTKIATVSKKGTITAKKVGTVKITITAAAKGNYKKTTKTITIKVTPAKTSKLTLANTAKGVKLTWKKVAGATGYYVFRNGKKIAKIKKAGTVTYTDKKAKKNGTKYQYQVFPYAKTGKGAGSAKKTIYFLTAPKITGATNSSAKKITAKWKKNTKATGYEVKYTLGKTSKTKDIKKKATVKAVLSGLKKSKTYKVSVRAYKKVGKTKYYSPWSTAKSVRIKK